MKAKSHIALLTALCLLVSMLFGGAASADSVTVTADRLNIRKDADAASKIVDTVSEGEELSFVSESGDWYQVKNGNDTGFVLKEYVELDDAKMEEDVLKNTETFSGTKTGRAVFRVNMRALPTTEAKVVAIVSENASVTVKGSCGVWYVVEYNGKTGYIMAQYVTLDGETVAPSVPDADDNLYGSSKTGVATTDVKLRKAPSTASAIEDIIEDDDVVIILGESGEFYKVSFGGKEGYAAKAYISVTSAGSNATGNESGNVSTGSETLYAAPKTGMATDRVNMRSEPSTGAGIIMVVGKNETVSVTGETDSWYKVSVNGRDGYIYKEWVAVNTTVYDSAKSGATTEEVNFRAGASTSSAVLKVLKGDTPVSVLAHEDGWYKVTADGQTGYIMAEYVRISDTVTEEGDVVPDGLISYSAARNGKTTESVKLRGAASTDSDVVSILAGGTAVSLLGEQGGFYQAKVGSLFGYIAKDYVTLVTTGADTTVEEEKDENASSVNDTIYASSKNGVTTVRVNMRRTPEGDVLFTLPADTKVTLLGEAGSWYKVTYSNSTGYIAKDYVSEELIVPSQPEQDDESDATVEGKGTTAYITGSSVNMRRGAGTDSGIIKVLKYGAEISYYSLNDGWYLIKAGDDTGYVSSKYVSTEKPEAEPETEPETETGEVDPGSGKVQMADWFESDISDKFAIGDIVTVTDVETGLSWRVKRSGGYNHADVQPLTAEDTAKMKQAYGGSWSWNRRAIWVTVDGVRYAASMNGMPHGTGSITTNNFDGHHCIHFLNSRTHTGNRWDTAHQNMVQKAFKAGQ